MDVAQVGTALGRQHAERHLRRSGLAVASEPAIRAAALREWESLGHLLIAGSPEVDAFIRAYVEGYRACDALCWGQAGPAAPGAAQV